MTETNETPAEGRRLPTVQEAQAPVTVPTILAERRRVEAFSDGVFAIALTLFAQWPTYLAYLTSFRYIWVNHHPSLRAAAKSMKVLDLPSLMERGKSQGVVDNCSNAAGLR